MNKGFLIRLGSCLVAIAMSTYSYVEKQNELTQLSLRTPVLMKELKELKEQNTRLYYQIQAFESPAHLMHLARDARFTHLHYPSEYDVVNLSQGIALKLEDETTKRNAQFSYSSVPIMVGSVR